MFGPSSKAPLSLDRKPTIYVKRETLSELILIISDCLSDDELVELSNKIGRIPSNRARGIPPVTEFSPAVEV